MSTLSSVRPAVAVIAGAALALGGALVAVNPAIAAVGDTFHVAATGDDTSGDGSLATPFATIAKAVQVAVDGDTVSVGAGTFAPAVVDEDLTLTGAGPTTEVTGQLQLSPGAEGSTVSGFHFTSIDNQIWAVGLDGSAVTTISDNLFDMPTDTTTQPNSVLDSSASGLTVSGNTFVGDGSFGDAVSVNLIGSGIHDIVITGNTSTGYGNFVVANGNDPHGLTDLVVSDNVVSGTLGTAIFIGDAIDGVDVTGNLVANGGSSAVSFTSFLGSITLGGVTDAHVTGNTFVNNLRGINAIAGSLTSTLEATGNAFLGNTTGVNNNSSATIDASGSVWSIPAGPLGIGDDKLAGTGSTTVAPASTIGTAFTGATSSTTGLTSTVHLGAAAANGWFAVGGLGAPESFGWVQASGSGDLSVVWPVGTVAGAQKVAVATRTTRSFVTVTIPEPATNTKAPVPGISGYTIVGRTLTAIPRTWEPSGATLTLQWNADGAPISGATGGTLVLTPALAGKKISLTVTATRGTGAAVARTSPQTAAVSLGALSAAAPLVSGSRTVGATLTADPGVWGPVAVTHTYRWMRDGRTIAGATASTYVQTNADRNHRIQVIVSGSAPGYTTMSVKSAIPAKTGYRLVGIPASITIPAAPKVGTALAMTVSGAWTSGAKLTYVWRANGALIKGATRSSYTPLPADLGKTITVTVTAAKTAYTAARIASNTTSPVAPGTFATSPVPVITRAQVGYAAAITTGTWSPAATFAYKWYLDGVLIAGATSAVYTPTAVQIGHDLTVEVTGSRAGFTAVTVSSAVKTVTTGIFADTVKPVVSGVARVGRVLTASVKAWSPAAQFAYQWKLDGIPIAGAVDNIYTVSSEDIGGRLTVTVTGARDGFISGSETSNPTAAVTP